MRGWRLESPDQNEVPSVFNTASGTVVADVQELSPTVWVLHWVAPRSYLGNRVSYTETTGKYPHIHVMCNVQLILSYIL